jgi:hypothetical protein
VAAHAFRRSGGASVASQPSLPGWERRSLAGTLLIIRWCRMTYLGTPRGDLCFIPQTDAPSRGNELLSALSQLKHWNVRI